VRISEVHIEGLKKLDTTAVRNMLSIRPGIVYQQDKLYQTQRDLYAMGVFRSANVILVDSLKPADPADTLVRVLVQTDEGPRHRVRTGIGYGTIECFRLQAGWTAFGFLGGARALDLTGRLGKVGVGRPFDASLQNTFLCGYAQSDTLSDRVTYNLAATLRQPVFLSPRHNASIALFAERREEYQAYTREAVGTNLGVTFNARRVVPVTLSYGYSVGRTTANDLAFCSVFLACTESDRAFLRDRRALGAISLTAVRDRANSPFEPSRGSIVTVGLVHANRLLGSDSGYRFNRGEVEVVRYHPIGRSTVFAWRVKAGTIAPGPFVLSGQAGRYVPPDQRFYAGGPNSVRGFRLNGLGPRVYVIDSTDVTDPSTFVIDTITGDTLYRNVRAAATGGNSLVLANAELRFPGPVILEQRLRLGIFVDIGQLYQRGPSSIAFNALRITPGVGVRLATPLGPVRLDVAYNGYAPEPGSLLLQKAGGDFEEHSPSYPRTPTPPRRFVDRLVFQFAIGQAY
jgi:outer membrane protein assembly factor BamA